MEHPFWIWLKYLIIVVSQMSEQLYMSVFLINLRVCGLYLLELICVKPAASVTFCTHHRMLSRMTVSCKIIYKTGVLQTVVAVYQISNHLNEMALTKFCTKYMYSKPNQKNVSRFKIGKNAPSLVRLLEWALNNIIIYNQTSWINN